MTIIYTMAMCTDSSLTNAECKPLEELKIKSFVDGHWVDIPALDEHWVSHGRVFVQYFPPPLLNDLDEVYPLGAKEDWLERMSYFQSDLKWLLCLNHHRFWSQIVNGEDSLIGVESFLQEATPFYVMKSFPNDSKMIDEYKVAQHLVFLVLIRLTTQKESEKEWIGSKKLGQLWYDKYLVTLPILFDMCLLFGQTNKAQLTAMVTRIFEIQPLYNEDVKNAIVFVDERLRMVQEKMKSKKSNNSYQPLKLIDHSKSQHSMMRSDFTLLSLTDILLYLLDTAVNLTSFLAVYQPARAIFHSLHFETRIVSVYENTVPSLCQELDLLAKKEDTIDVYFDLKYKLDLTRLELLKLFRYCSYSTLDSLLDSRSTLSEEEIKSSVDNFISVLSEFLSDRVFVQDYNNKYPVDCDLNMLSQVCPELDSVKCEFLIESVLSCYDLPASKPKASTSSLSMNKLANDYSGPSNIVNGNSVNVKKKVKGVELQSLITEVKDVLPHLGDGFVQKCLEYYDYKSESVVIAILESTLPEPLECLDMDMPAIEDTETVEENGLPERINVFDNDELDIMTQDQIDISKVHTGKWKHGKKCANELLNDKSHINHIRESYAKLGIVEDENVYEDEYDDTYDGLDVSVKEAEEPERRPFTTPRVLKNASGHDNSPEEEESDKEEIDNNARYQDQFVENPEVVRARLEQRRQQRQQNRGFKHQSRDLVGKPKGQGQESNILHNREFKNSHKSSYANHNRRAGAQRKRNQGMMPS